MGKSLIETGKGELLVGLGWSSKSHIQAGNISLQQNKYLLHAYNKVFANKYEDLNL